ncbi:MAG: CAP domain-containing protein [Lachnospiraceae bacterium]|nr:CAP domain-containing protein [Lachnospiraceae bacterium]
MKRLLNSLITIVFVILLSITCGMSGETAAKKNGRVNNIKYNIWENSPGHYRNMTNNTYKYLGIYIYQNPVNGHYYAVQKLQKDDIL